jgi:hypothetical protein
MRVPLLAAIGVCTIVEGKASDATCCCRCRKPKPPATGTTVRSCADHYAQLFTWTPMFPGTLGACGMPKLEKAARKAAKQADGHLVAAEAACQAGNEAKETKKAGAAVRDVSKLKGKLDKLEASGKIGAGCADGYKQLLDEFVVGTQTPGAQATTTTTSTTTTTMAPAGRAVTLGHATGPFTAGSVICLARIAGGCVAPVHLPNCACVHLHNATTLSIDGAGSYADPEFGAMDPCGHGCVAPAAGCGPDTIPDC